MNQSLLTDSQCRQFSRDGYLLAPGVFSAEEVEVLKAEALRLTGEELGRVYERDGKTVRAVHGGHLFSDVMARLIRLPRLLHTAEKLLGSPAHVLQFKINFKAAFTGESWPWHQDFIYFHNEDGLPKSRFFSALIFLDPATNHNGPLLVIKGSNSYGIIAPSHPEGTLAPPTAVKEGAPEWVRNFTVDGKYNLDQAKVTELAEQGLEAATGEAGSVFFLDGNTVHGSAGNMTPQGRAVLIITYNSVENPLEPRPKPRPEFLVSRDFTPLQPLPTDELVGPGKGR